MIESIKINEGTPAAQAEKGWFKYGKFYPYQDTTLKAIGYGHNFTSGEAYQFVNGITPAEAETLLVNDLKVHVYHAKQLAKQYSLRIPPDVQRVIVEMVYQMGYGGAQGFKKFFRALKEGNYRKAIFEMENSSWYKQTKGRVKKHIAVLAKYQ